MSNSSYDVELDQSWSIGTKPHGGYLLSTMAGLALDETHPHPMAISAHYVQSPDAGPATVEVERLRTGREPGTIAMIEKDKVKYYR